MRRPHQPPHYPASHWTVANERQNVRYLAEHVMLEILFEPAIHFLAYWTGKPVVRILSLGRLHVAIDAEPESSEKRKLRWSSVTFVRRGKRYVDGEIVCLVGLIAWAVVIAAIVLIARRW